MNRAVSGGKVLVAGATGRVGSAAVRELLDAGLEVRALVRSEEKGSALRSLGAEIAVGDVTVPRTLAPAVEGCSWVYSALAGGPGRGSFEAVEYRGNVNLLSAAIAAGMHHFVYTSALLADHPLAQSVGAFREKARFEAELEATGGISRTVLRPAMLTATLDLMLLGAVAFVPGRQRRPVSWISPQDVARAAAAALRREITGRYEVSGPDTLTFDEAFGHLGRARRKRVLVLHPPLITLKIPGLASPYLRELAAMMAFFDSVGFSTSSTALQDTFGVSGLTIEGWARENR